jgi:hypothetical protein
MGLSDISFSCSRCGAAWGVPERFEAGLVEREELFELDVFGTEAFG